MPAPSALPSRPRAQLVQGVAWLIAALVLGQAALAGRFITTDPSLVTAHRVLAEAIGPVALVLVWGAFTLRPIHRTLRAGSVLILALVIVQTGLGFAGRKDAEIASLHVPVGVALFGLTIAVAMKASATAAAPSHG